MLLNIRHMDDVSTMPSWWKISREMLPPKTRTLYEQICRDEYGASNEAISIHLLSTQLGISRNAIQAGIQQLDKLGYLTYDEDDGVCNISVSLPPYPDSETEEMYSIKGAEMKLTLESRVKMLLAVWQQQFQEYTKTRWSGRTHGAKGFSLDTIIAKRLCRNEPDNEVLIKMVKFYWLYIWDRENGTLAAFEKNYDSIAARQREMEQHG